MPKMQEQLSAGAWQPTIPGNEALLCRRAIFAENAGAFSSGGLAAPIQNNEALLRETHPCMLEMQQHFPAPLSP